MVSEQEFSNPPYRQGRSHSCLLASYASALYPFTMEDENKYFEEIAKLLNITTSTLHQVFNNDSMISDKRIGTFKKNGSGYKWLEELHLNCPAQVFKIARTAVEFLPVQFDDLQSNLQHLRSTAIIHISKNNMSHSLSVAHNGKWFFSRDTAIPGKAIFDSKGPDLKTAIEGLYGAVKIGEARLIKARSSNG